jgi:aspartate 1-decarboxylase
MKKSVIYIIITAFLAITCNNLDVADIAPRTTFLKFFEGPYSITASSFEIIPDGYIMVGNMLVEDEVNDTTYFETVVIKTDKNGNRIGEYIRIPGGTGKSIKPLINNGAVTGYVVVGDRILIDPLEEQAANVSISSLRALYLNNNLEPVDSILISETDPNALYKEDFTGESVEITSDGRILILGTVKRGVANQQTAPAEPFILALKSDFTFDWFQRYDLIGRTSQNSKSIHYNNGKIIWATAIADVAGDFVNSWVGIPIVDENSIFPNYSVFGQNTNQLFIPNDIQPASSTSFEEYGVVGTYSQDTKGSKGNIFFLRVDINGNIIPGSAKYFDAVDLPINGSLANRDDSFIIDTGEAITSTQDGGFVLAGTLDTNDDKGNGGLDLFLIKVNAFGDPIWSKTIGGAGDETPVTIRETTEGDLVICGTNKLKKYSTVFLMKTDKDGELKN